jgi:multidrug efflux pump subunit AcrA (membrane-fusion protein)
MSYRSGFFSGFIFSLIACGASAAAYWIATTKPESETKKSSSSAPAKVAKPLKEEEINTITLSLEAIERLGLRTGTIEKKRIQRTRIYSGELMIPAGQAIVVSAPLSGIVKALPQGVPRAGQVVEVGQPIFQFMPLLTPEARANLTTSAVDASEQVKSAQTQVESTRIALERARRVFQSEAGSRRAVDEAQAQHELALRGLDAGACR